MNKNIVYIHSHDTGRYIQPYGHAVPTPRLMELAQQSVLFRQAYSAAPTCSASRSSLLTGMYPHCNGMLGLAHRGFALDDPSRHLASFLSRCGYETALFGIQHEIAAGKADRIGYQLQQEGKSDRENAVQAAEFLKGCRERPFFLSFGMFHTHKPYPERYDGINPDYMTPSSPQYDNRANREEMARYVASAREMDTCAGVVLDALREAGLEEDTIVMYTTDHGIALPQMKCTLYDSGIGVSLILRYSGNPMAGMVTDALVSHIDMFPTLCELTGLSKPEWLQGESLVPLLEGRCERVREELFAEVNYHAAYEPMRCIRTERYKLIRRFDEHDGVVPANIDGGIGKQFLLDNGLLQRRLKRTELFDLVFDPTERDNLSGSATYAAVETELMERLVGWMQRTNDPLLQGRVPKPSGARVNKLVSVEPNEVDFE